MSKKPCYSIYRSLKAFMAYEPNIKPVVILHGSCVLEDEEELKKLAEFLTETDSEYRAVCTFFIMKDTSQELELLSRYSNIPQVKRNADFILNDLCAEHIVPIHTNELYVEDSENMIPINRILTTCDKVLMCFYSAAAAEEFVNSAKRLRDPAFCLLYYNCKYVCEPAGAARLYTVPTPFSSFSDSTPREWRFREAPERPEHLQSAKDMKSVYKKTYHSVKVEAYSGEPKDVFGGKKFNLHDEDITETLPGGESLLFICDDCFIKIYKHTENGLEDKIRLLASYDGFFGEKIIFPSCLIYDEKNNFAGFSMRKAGKTKSVTLTYAANTGLPEDLEFTDQSAPDFRLTEWEVFDRKKVLREIIVLLLEIRLFDMDILDLSMMNIIVDLHSDVNIIDSNSFQTDGFTNDLMPELHHPDIPAGTGWYREQKYTDFLFAIMLFRCMLHDADPSDPEDSTESGFKNSHEPFHYKVDDVSEVNNGEACLLWLSLDKKLRESFCSVFNFEKILTPGEWIEILQASDHTKLYD